MNFNLVYTLTGQGQFKSVRVSVDFF